MTFSHRFHTCAVFLIPPQELLLLFNQSDGTERRKSAVCLLSEHTDLRKLLNASGKGTTHQDVSAVVNLCT